PRIPARMASATEAPGALASLPPRLLEAAACSLAAVRYRPSATWLEGLGGALEARWTTFSPSQLAATLVGAAACGLTALPPAARTQLLPRLIAAATAPGSATSPGTLAQLVWSAGHFGCCLQEPQPEPCMEEGERRTAAAAISPRTSPVALYGSSDSGSSSSMPAASAAVAPAVVLLQNAQDSQRQQQQQGGTRATAEAVL
ncbi:hypothetical protein Agub_g13342, partial [Astrephomene gubernaculifera]